jgi:hypothetical protein
MTELARFFNGACVSIYPESTMVRGNVRDPLGIGTSADHRKCGRTRNQSHFRSSGESHQTCRRSSCLLPKRFSKAVSSFVSFHWRAMQAGICFLVSIEWWSSPVRLVTSIIAGWRELASGRSWWSLAPLAVARFGVVGRTDARKA